MPSNDLSTVFSSAGKPIAANRASTGQFIRRVVGHPWLWPLAGLGLCWFLFFQELSDEWWINPQYSYGYVVPFLGLALFLRRWPERPHAGASRSTLAFLLAPSLLLLIPLIRVCLQANPEWRLLYWLHGIIMVGLTMTTIYYVGGRPWLSFFAYPVLFTLIAVPWPMELEQWMIQGLMRVTAALTVELVSWFGIPAFQHGNVIETTVGMVGIDEACSGVRSLQAALMLSLFLGEMHRFSSLRRITLLVASLVIDLFANLARTSFLVWAAANKGLHQMEAWHDAAGVLVMVIVLPVLLGLSLLLKPSQQSISAPRTGRNPVARLLPAWIGWAVVVWIGLGEAASEAWYRMHETTLVATPRWSAVWPSDSPRFQTTTLPEKALSILRCSESNAANWEDSNGNQWSGFLLRWAPGKNSAQLAKGHRPEICFTAAGARLLDDYGQVTVAVADFQIPFRHQRFAVGERNLHVFYCLWPDRISLNQAPVLEDGSKRSRLAAVLTGKRHLGQQVLELVVTGPDAASDAASALREVLPGLIHPLSAH